MLNMAWYLARSGWRDGAHWSHAPIALAYFVAALLVGGLFGALLLSRSTARLLNLPVEPMWDAGLFAVAAAFVASRMLLVAEHPRTFLRFPLYLLLQPSLTAWGLLLAVAAVLGYLWARHLSPWATLEAWTPPALLLWACLALGHFLEGSDPGMPTAAPWGVRAAGTATAEQPVALALALAAAVLALWTMLRLSRGYTSAGQGLVWAGLVQFMASFFRQPAPTTVGGLEPLEWVGLGVAGAGLLLLRRSGRPLSRSRIGCKRV